MRVLQELLAINEEKQVMARPMELANFVHGSEGLEDAFPRLLKKKWNTPGEIVWHGLPLFHRENGNDWNDDGEAFDKIYEAIREYVEDDYELNYSITINNTLPELSDDDDEDGNGDDEMQSSEEVELTLTFDQGDRDSLKPVWWGYDKENDKILVGYDAWPTNAEDEFNEEFDKAFERMTNQPHDMDNEEHNKIFNVAHKEFIDHAHFWGLCFSVSKQGNKIKVEEEYPPSTGGFFRNDFYRMLKQRIDSGDIWTSDHL